MYRKLEFHHRRMFRPCLHICAVDYLGEKRPQTFGTVSDSSRSGSSRSSLRFCPVLGQVFTGNASHFRPSGLMAPRYEQSSGSLSDETIQNGFFSTRWDLLITSSLRGDGLGYRRHRCAPYADQMTGQLRTGENDLLSKTLQL